MPTCHIGYCSEPGLGSPLPGLNENRCPSSWHIDVCEQILLQISKEKEECAVLGEDVLLEFCLYQMLKIWIVENYFPQGLRVKKMKPGLGLLHLLTYQMFRGSSLVYKVASGPASLTFSADLGLLQGLALWFSVQT